MVGIVLYRYFITNYMIIVNYYKQSSQDLKLMKPRTWEWEWESEWQLSSDSSACMLAAAPGVYRWYRWIQIWRKTGSEYIPFKNSLKKTGQKFGKLTFSISGSFRSAEWVSLFRLSSTSFPSSNPFSWPDLKLFIFKYVTGAHIANSP